jgi:hypothetical protein
MGKPNRELDPYAASRQSPTWVDRGVTPAEAHDHSNFDRWLRERKA